MKNHWGHKCDFVVIFSPLYSRRESPVGMSIQLKLSVLMHKIAFGPFLKNPEKFSRFFFCANKPRSSFKIAKKSTFFNEHSARSFSLPECFRNF